MYRPGSLYGGLLLPVCRLHEPPHELLVQLHAFVEPTHMQHAVVMHEVEVQVKHIVLD